MSDDDQRERTLSDSVAEEVRVMLVRRRMSGRELARKLHVSPGWVSYRLSGVQPIDLNDLAKIADVLEVNPADLLPKQKLSGYGVEPRPSRSGLGERVVAVGGSVPRRTAHPRKDLSRRSHVAGRAVSQTRPLSPLSL